MYQISAMSLGQWVFARGHSIQRRRKRHLYSWDFLTHYSEIMIYTKVHRCVKDVSLWNIKMSIFVFGWPFKILWVLFAVENKQKNSHYQELPTILYCDYGIELNSLIMRARKEIMAKMAVRWQIKAASIHTVFRLSTQAIWYLDLTHLKPNSYSILTSSS